MCHSRQYAICKCDIQEFLKGMELLGNNYKTRYAQSNGLVERNVQTIKKLMEKAKHTNYDYRLALLEFRNTCITGMKSSPANLFFSRSLRSVLPCTADSLKPRIPEEKDYQHLKKNQNRQEYYYNKDAKDMTQFNIGDKVRMWDHKRSIWRPAVVKQICAQPRSYVVQTNDGKCFRRNRRHLRLTVEPNNRFLAIYHDFSEGEEDSGKEINEHQQQGEMLDREMLEQEKCGKDDAQVGLQRVGRPERQKQIPGKFKDFIMY